MLQSMRSCRDLCHLHSIKDVCITNRLIWVDTTPYGHYTRNVVLRLGRLWTPGISWSKLAATRINKKNVIVKGT